MTDARNGRQLAKDASLVNLYKVLDENDIDDAGRKAAILGYTDGHKNGYRAASGAAYVAVGAMLDILNDDSTVEQVRLGLEGLREAIKGNAK